MYNKKLVISALVLACIAVAFFLYNNITTAPPETVFCTMEAKLCPDGSYVGRSGPRCEFALCPTEQTIAIETNFSVPPLYPQYKWSQTSDVFQGNESLNVLYVRPNVAGNDFVLHGKYYEAANMNPNAVSWQKMSDNAPKNEPIGFYSGDNDFVTYYDGQLKNFGYAGSQIHFDKDLNLVTDSDKTVFSLGAMDADGPTGFIRGYLRYYKGKIRVIIVSTSVTKDSVFVSDVADLKNIIRLTAGQ